MKKLILPVILLLLLQQSCKDSGTNPPPGNPPGWQEDIPWPSLADSPWPMYRCDPQNTGRSMFAGPLSGEIFRRLNALNLQSVPVIGKDSTLFFSTSNPGTLYAFRNYSVLDWTQLCDAEVHTSPIIDNEDNIYVLGVLSLKKYDKFGNLLWTLAITNGALSSALTIDKIGNIYYVGNNLTINCIEKTGIVKWSIVENRLLNHPYHEPAFSADGKTLYLQGGSVSIIALDVETRSVKWVWGNTRLRSAPVVDSYGNIYITPAKPDNDDLSFYSLDPFGNVRWKNNISSQYGEIITEPTINKYGEIIIGDDDTLYCYKFDGSLIWKKSIAPYTAPLVISDSDCNIYLTVWSNNNSKVIALSRLGETLWEFTIDDSFILQTPILTDVNTLIVSSFRENFLYIVR